MLKPMIKREDILAGGVGVGMIYELQKENDGKYYSNFLKKLRGMHRNNLFILDIGETNIE